MRNESDTQAPDLFGQPEGEKKASHKTSPNAQNVQPTPGQNSTPAPAFGNNSERAAHYWGQYTPAPDQHPALERFNLFSHQARVIPEGANLPFADATGVDWLVLPLSNGRGQLADLAFLHPEPGQHPRFLQGYPQGAFMPSSPDRGQTVYVLADPLEGMALYRAGWQYDDTSQTDRFTVAVAITFTPDDWSCPRVPSLAELDTPADLQARGGDNLTRTAAVLARLGHPVAVPVLAHRADAWRGLLAETEAVVLPLQAPFSMLDTADWPGLPDHLSGLWQQHAPAFVRQFNSGSGRYEVRENGLFYVDRDKDGNEYDRHLSPPVHVLAKTRTKDGTAWGRLLEWYDGDNRRHEWAMPMDLLQGEATDVCKLLAKRGADVSLNRRCRDLFTAYLQTCPTHRRALCVDRTGWHGDCFVLPNRVYGHSSGSEITVYQGRFSGRYRQAGTLAQWREQVAALAVGNSRLAFAISAAFAGPLLELAGLQGGGFHFRSGSSEGKSTILRVACSVWGDPGQYRRTWKSTANAMEGMAAEHNAGLLVLDELGEGDPRTVGDVVYMLANGQGKGRMAKTLEVRESESWRIVYLSSGEETLEAIMAKAGQKPKAGQDIRLADIPAGAGAGLGVWDTSHGMGHGLEGGKSFSKRLDASAARLHGSAGDAWLSHLTTHRERISSDLQPRIRAFADQHTPSHAGGQVGRVCDLFALVAVAGELATLAGITGWSTGEATAAAARCFADWLAVFGTGNREHSSALEQVRAFIQAHGSSRFEPLDREAWNAWSSSQPRTVNRVGYWRDTPQGREYLIFPEQWKNEVCKGLDSEATARTIRDAGHLKHQPDRLTHLEQPPDTTKRQPFIVLKPSILDGTNGTNGTSQAPQGFERVPSARTPTVQTVQNPAQPEPVPASDPACTALYRVPNGVTVQPEPAPDKACTARTACTVEKTPSPIKTANGYPLNRGFAPASTPPTEEQFNLWEGDA